MERSLSLQLVQCSFCEKQTAVTYKKGIKIYCAYCAAKEKLITVSEFSRDMNEQDLAERLRKKSNG